MLLAQSPKDRIILGLMTFGPDTDKGARITSLDEYNKCLDLFQEKGYNELDTARVYVGGKQEDWTAQARWKERGLILATKWYPMEAGAHKPATIKAKVEESLRALKTDTVDIFYLHAADRSEPFEPALKAVNELHQQGKFVQFALSNFTAFEVAEVVMICRQHGWVRPTLYQAMYNAITRGIEPELIPACRRYGLDIVVYNPLAGGLFSGKYKTSEIPAEGRYSDATGVTGSMYRKRYFKDSTFEALAVIEPVVQKHGLTLLETGFRWLVHHSGLKMRAHGGNDGIILGVSSFDQLRSNLADCEKGPLPDEVVQALDQAWLVAKPFATNYWHGELKYTYDTRQALFGPKA
ncbi:MAG: hypothetical protein M1826_004238 [Phylliscum demangeonii]|nr:MAG: hypothetical protein M1826_004238 [Phylliscum demangeonii]